MCLPLRRPAISRGASEEVWPPLKGVILPLCSGRPHLECCVQHEADTDMLEQVRGRALKVVRGKKHLSCGARLGVLELFSLENRKF